MKSQHSFYNFTKLFLWTVGATFSPGIICSILNFYYVIPVRADNYFIGLSLNREIWKTQKHLPASSMPWARIAPNLAMTSSCLSLMTLEYSCLNWFTWRNKKKNYSWNLLFCCVISEQATYCSNGNETWVLNFTTFKREEYGPDLKISMVETMAIMTFLVWEHQFCFQSSFHGGWFRLEGMWNAISHCTTASKQA